jgi:hypothetical protein
MMTNVGVLDAAVRLLVAVLLLAWSYGEFGLTAPSLPVAWAIWLGGLALGVTGLFRYCPIHVFYGTHSCAPMPDDD